jgi:hypothetical protein
MDFEHAMAQFFGIKAEYIANDFYDKRKVNKWFIKAIYKMSKDIQNIDTTTRHKEILMDNLEWVKTDIKEHVEPMIIISHLFMLCSRFLGYDYVKGVSFHTPFYYQTHGQYCSHQALNSGKDRLELHRSDHRNILIKQKEIAYNLTKEGFNDFQIGMILGLSEYRIKKMKKGL